ncbi:MAG: hypothetical protein D6788_08230 [Planctomycetota bacterium]|nr:MAG: hypothetical protein D6788_08230 [Planctomycetota bacterium]
MSALVNDLLAMLRSWNPAAGFPLIVVGVALMLFGYRLWRLCVILAYGAVGVAVMLYGVGLQESHWVYALAGGCLLGLLSSWWIDISLSLLGGVIAAGLVSASLERLGITGMAVWFIAGAALLGGTAFAYLNRTHLVAVVTAALGACVFLGGAYMWFCALRESSAFVRSLTPDTPYTLPFLLLTTTVVSAFYQSAEIHRQNGTTV